MIYVFSGWLFWHSSNRQRRQCNQRIIPWKLDNYRIEPTSKPPWFDVLRRIVRNLQTYPSIKMWSLSLKLLSNRCFFWMPSPRHPNHWGVVSNFIWVGVLYKSHQISHDTPPNTLLSNVQQLFHRKKNPHVLERPQNHPKTWLFHQLSRKSCTDSWFCDLEVALST